MTLGLASTEPMEIKGDFKMYRTMNKWTIALALGAFTLTSPMWAQGMGGPGGGGHGGPGHGDGGPGDGGNGGGMHQDSLTTVTLTGTVFTEMILVDPDCDSSFAGPGHHHGPGMGGPGMCDSLGFGDWDSTFFGGFGGYHHGEEFGGAHEQIHQRQYNVGTSLSAGYLNREEPDSLIYHEVYFIDVDGDSVMDYVLNFGPAWYLPVDSTLTRPVAGDIITVTGIQMMESPLWDAEVLVVTELNGGIWREFGSMGHGGPHAPEMSQSRNMMIGDNYNFPNPFNPTTTISFNILEAGNVNVTIYDITGRTVKNLVVNQNTAPGVYNVVWNGTDVTGSPVASGLYLYRITMGNNQVNRLITFLK